MSRILKLAALIAVAAAFYVAIGRAADHEVRYQDRVITTRHGRTVDCRVDRYEDGSIYLNDCNEIQVP